MALRIEEMAPWHAPEVLRIYGEGISSGPATFETQAPAWEEWDLRHMAACRLVAVEEGRLQGWAALSAVSNRPVYKGVAEVSLYVSQGARGRGVGKALLEALVDSSERAGIWTLQAGIFPENEASIRLHRACGFRAVGIRERLGCRGGTWKDVLLMERRSDRTGI